MAERSLNTIDGVTHLILRSIGVNERIVPTNTIVILACNYSRVAIAIAKPIGIDEARDRPTGAIRNGLIVHIRSMMWRNNCEIAGGERKSWHTRISRVTGKEHSIALTIGTL